MTGHRFGIAQGRTAAAILAVALFLRVLVPAGWMPSEEHLGIRPCLPRASTETAAAPRHDDHAATPAHHKQEPTDQPGHDQAHPCSFSLLAASLLAPDLPTDALPLPPAAEGQDLPSGPHAAPPRGLAAPPPPATGPPSFA